MDNFVNGTSSIQYQQNATPQKNKNKTSSFKNRQRDNNHRHHSITTQKRKKHNDQRISLVDCKIETEKRATINGGCSSGGEGIDFVTASTTIPHFHFDFPPITRSSKEDDIVMKEFDSDIEEGVNSLMLLSSFSQYTSIPDKSLQQKSTKNTKELPPFLLRSIAKTRESKSDTKESSADHFVEK